MYDQTLSLTICFVLRRTQEYFTNMTAASTEWEEAGQSQESTHDPSQVAGRHPHVGQSESENKVNLNSQ